MIETFNGREAMTEISRRQKSGDSYTVTAFSAKLSITEHPEFNRPRWDWGVIKAWTNEETGEERPEDRSGYLPQYDGMAWADFWDAEKEEFRSDFPMYQSMLGVKYFIAQGTRIEP